MTQGPTRHQVLISLTPAAAEMVVANVVSAVKFCNKGLVSTYSKHRVKSVHKAWDGMSMSTNSVASAAELEIIKQWLKKAACLGKVTEVEPYLPQSKSFLKILRVPYWNSNSSLPITLTKVAEALSSSFFSLRVLHWPLCLILWRSLLALTCLLSRLTFGTLRRVPKIRPSLIAHLILGVILL